MSYSEYRTFSLPSTDTNHTLEYMLKRDTFTGNVTVQVTITAVLNITQQCGHTFSGINITNSTTSGNTCTVLPGLSEHTGWSQSYSLN